ncbi:heme oxygenase 1 isoform X1 [Danaus plexippus]|uniref:heme oxygenase 1 isoform X1 n=1 Tax=Danaus plexippus TaxID=13037 RepID=UPI002AB2491A|nr:heme oxygenase 1 isoform X1 [Danaus plexippus]
MFSKEEPFTTRMRYETRKIHSVSDALVNAKFALSLKDPSVWGGGLFVFYHIFAYLEDAKDKLNVPELKKIFVDPVMERKNEFEVDLAEYLGEDWSLLPKSPELENYLQHLKNLERDKPILLLAYIYHLYLGMLSGGQILAKKRNLFGEADQEKPRKYQDRVTCFGNVDIGELKKKMKQAMNEIAENMSEDEKLEFIEESNHVFIMNNLVVNSIQGQSQIINRILYKSSLVLLFVVGVTIAYKMVR